MAMVGVMANACAVKCAILSAMLCVAAAAGARVDAGRMAIGQPYRPCLCTARTLDCSFRGRTTLGPKDQCNGKTTSINLHQNAFVSFPSGLSSSIVEINISSNYLTSMPRPPQVNTRVTVLDVSDNNIGQTQEELRMLNDLKTLLLRGNRLTSLNFLPEPCSLRNLDASDNNLRFLDGRLNRCFTLDVLDLSGNQINYLPPGILSELKNLKLLQISNSNISKFDSKSFQGLEKLKVLDLSENSLTTCPPKGFSWLKTLVELNLESNKLFKLFQDSFAGLFSLETLKLSNNLITNLPAAIFTNLKNLKHVVLAQNKITGIPEGLFYGLTKLKTIEMWHNQIETLSPNTFAGLNNLKTVSLANNKLSFLPSTLFSGLSALETLQIGGNFLTDIPIGIFKDTKSLKNLYLSSNRLTSFTGSTLAGIKSLDILELEDNQLEELPQYNRKWPKVEYAIFSGNRIRDVYQTTLRSWLDESGSTKVVILSTPDTMPLRNPASFRWVLSDPNMVMTVGARCNCGSIRKGKREVRLCLEARCGWSGTYKDWIAAVMATNSPALSS